MRESEVVWFTEDEEEEMDGAGHRTRLRSVLGSHGSCSTATSRSTRDEEGVPCPNRPDAGRILRGLRTSGICRRRGHD